MIKLSTVFGRIATAVTIIPSTLVVIGWMLLRDIALGKMEGSTEGAAGNPPGGSQWKKNSPPTVEDLNGSPEEFFWVRGGNFNRTFMVRANSGVNSQVVDGKRQFRADVNFMFYTKNLPGHIWAGDLQKWHGLSALEWAGPVPRPDDDKATAEMPLCPGNRGHGGRRWGCSLPGQ